MCWGAEGLREAALRDGVNQGAGPPAVMGAAASQREALPHPGPAGEQRQRNPEIKHQDQSVSLHGFSQVFCHSDRNITQETRKVI